MPLSAKDAEEVALAIMNDIDPKLSSKYSAVIRFLYDFPEFASTGRGGNFPPFGSHEYISRQAQAFTKGRISRLPTPPATVPDEMVSVILSAFWGIKKSELPRVIQEHQYAMASENIVGSMLEHYIASVVEEFDWVWCSGEVTKAIDFIKPPSDDASDWLLLQVKNRDNSENSSSARVRMGTPILKWHRTRSRTGETCWEVFPDLTVQWKLSEQGFQDFARIYLDRNREKTL